VRGALGLSYLGYPERSISHAQLTLKIPHIRAIFRQHPIPVTRLTHSLILAAAALLLPLTPAVAGKIEDHPTPLTPRQQAIHVLNRLAFGPAPGDIEHVTKIGWKSWVEQQLDRYAVDDHKLNQRLAKDYPSLKMSAAQAYRTYRPPEDTKPSNPKEEREVVLEKERLRRKLQAELDESVLVRAMESKRQLNEVIVDFWRNHLNVDSSKSPYWSNNYEEEVLRQHAFGKFEDLIMASAKHPAMLVYLDNHVSKKGNINENYARELMELHTLGVDNYYTQRDIIHLTRILTGWTCFWRYDDDGTEHWQFVFRPEHHDTKPGQVLGLRLDGTGGVTDGEMAVRYLARHEGTAQFISTKLCQYLVNDEPSEKLVDHVAAVFRATAGDLTEVYRAIIHSPEFMDPANYGAKHKTPFEFVVSAVRATNTGIKDARPTLATLDAMGQPVFKCDVPTGYSDAAEAWLDPGALVHRWTFAKQLATGNLEGLTIPASFHGPWNGHPLPEKSKRIANTVVPRGLQPRVTKIMTDSANQNKMIALALGSPAFQQQ
jgi:uncharacterized protein (DUF1800 family)